MQNYSEICASLGCKRYNFISSDFQRSTATKRVCDKQEKTMVYLVSPLLSGVDHLMIHMAQDHNAEILNWKIGTGISTRAQTL